MIELMEVFEEEDSASDNNSSELDKSNGSSASKTSGISTHSSSGSHKASPDVTQKKLLNTNMIPITSTITPLSQKSSVFIPPNLQKVNLKPVTFTKKETTFKRKAEPIPSASSALVKRPATIAAKPKVLLPRPQEKSPIQAQIQQVSGSTEGSSTQVVDKHLSVLENSNIKVESTTTQIKVEPVGNGFPETTEDQSDDLKLPPNFFKHLCSSNRHEAFGLYIANFMNRLDKSSARKLEFRLLQTITEFQSEHDN